jgi:hypothetical protein
MVAYLKEMKNDRNFGSKISETYVHGWKINRRMDL